MHYRALLVQLPNPPEEPVPRNAVTAPDAPAPVGPYSHAVRSAAAGGLVLLSGQTPIDPATGALVQGEVGTQTRTLHDIVLNS